MPLGTRAEDDEKSLPLPSGSSLLRDHCPKTGSLTTSHQASSPFNVQCPNLFDFGTSPHFPTLAQMSSVQGEGRGGEGRE